MRPYLFLPIGIVLSGYQMLAFAESTSCMVIGERTARISSMEGERAPVFVTKACETLRLVHGKAHATWIGKDGKPTVLQITASGVDAQTPSGTEERSVNVAWAELTTRRERQRPAYLRDVTNEAPKVYVPAEGLVLVEKLESDSLLRIDGFQGEKPEKLAEIKASKGERLFVPPGTLQADRTYNFVLQRSEASQTWTWQTVAASQASSIREDLAAINAAVTDPEHQFMLQALYFEQAKIRNNMYPVVQQVKARQTK